MRVALFCLVALCSGVASADYFTGNDLKKHLLDSGREVDEAMYRGYVAGVQDSYNGVLFCVPEEVLMSQASALVRKYIADKPKFWHKAGKQMIVDALREAYPCMK